VAGAPGENRDEHRAARGGVVCLLPFDLSARLERPLRRFADDEGIAMVVDHRGRERRSAGDRRERAWPGPVAEVVVASERRRMRNLDGRRVADRRATQIPVERPVQLPRRLDAHSDRLAFVERLDLSAEHQEDIDTARLVLRWQAGDRGAFATIYERYFDRVYGYLRIALNDSHEAEDATQQVFMSMMEAMSRFELRSAPVRGWLFRIVRNHAISHARRSGRVRLEEPSAVDRRRELAEEETSPEVLEWLADTDVVVLVERLPLAQRQVLLLRYMLDLSFQEVGEVLYRSPEAIRQLHQRALDSLRSRLAALGRTPSEAPGMRVQMRRRACPTLAPRRDRFQLRLTFAR
jgi:RNA polymerase sigma-70 factor (ECF subfamily)